jgi:hypothetical protein
MWGYGRGACMVVAQGRLQTDGIDIDIDIDIELEVEMEIGGISVFAWCINEKTLSKRG